ncbi:MAG: ADOP family duplicated permease [Acidobacteriota bacterium]|nr:ADOP family duplicated permease [Acidobacteriota bacterium]
MRKFILKLRKRPHLERDLDAEMEFHKMNSANFGNATRIREEARELWTFPFIESLLRDLRQSCRALAKSPSFSLVSLFTLSLGIGLNTAVFTLYDSLTYRLLPVKAPEELVRVVRQSGNALQPTNVSYADFKNLRSGLEAFADVIATSSSQTILGVITPATGIREGIKTQFVAGNYFDVLGVQCTPGRILHGDEQGVAVVSHTFWTRRLAADPTILGKVINLGGVQVTILGVAPKGFYGTDLPPHMPDVWIPLATQSRVLYGTDWAHDNTARTVQVLARRKPGITVSQLSKELRQKGGIETASDGRKSWLTATDATVFQTNMGGFRGTGTIGLILMGAVGVILLIGCINLVNLTLSRNAARKREIAVRLAIGASRSQIVQQLCTESLVLGIVAGAIGFGLSVFLCEWIRVGALITLDRISDELVGGFALNVAPDWRVFVYTLVLSVDAAALVGGWPALGSTQTGLNSSLKSEGLRQGQRHVLLTAQIAACFILLAGAGLLFRGAWQSRSADPGFSLDKILIMNVDLTMLDAASDDRKAVLRRVLDQTRSLHQVTSLALVDRSPFLGTGADQFENENHKHLRCRFNRVSGEFFNTLEIPILAGRSFSQIEAERGEAEVVVSEAAAQSYWPNQNPIGRRILVDPRSQSGLSHSSYTVVGIAKVVRNTFLSKRDDYYLYFPKPVSDEGGWVLVRTRISPEMALPSLRNVLMEINPALASHSYLISLEKGPVQIQRLMTDIPGILALVLGLLALILASVGVYGVVMYLVTQRIRVIGIHIALGAQRLDVIWLVLKEGLGCVARGTLIGLFGAACLSGLLATLVKTPDLPDLTYQAGAFNPATFLIALVTLALAVAAACLLPVYRATRVDPVMALRKD